MEGDLRIALAVCRSLVGDTRGNLERMNQFCASAKKKGAGLVCFPELSATGYHVRDEIRGAAEAIPGPCSRQISEMASRHGISILAGIAEKHCSRIYASHVLAEPGSGITGLYRKLHLGHPEKKIFTHGTHPPCLFETRGLTFGIQLCYDAHFPELSTAMAMNGADIIFIPHASPGTSGADKLGSWMRHLPARAFDNGVYVAAVNPVGENGCGLWFPGAAVVISPEGKMVSHSAGEDETMLIADLSAKTLESVRSHPMKYFLKDRRPEIYKIQL
ncbi:MAG: nitrilase-related carbon-nitrogen hydrolase [Desulfosalsimonas sp.]